MAIFVRCESTLQPFDEENGVIWIGEDLKQQLLIVQGRLSVPKIYHFDAEIEVWSEVQDAVTETINCHDGFCQANLHGDLLAHPSRLSDIKVIQVKVRILPLTLVFMTIIIFLSCLRPTIPI